MVIFRSFAGRAVISSPPIYKYGVPNGKYLDVPTMGEYIELLTFSSGINLASDLVEQDLNIYPNPSTGLVNFIFSLSERTDILLLIHDVNGKLISNVNQKHQLAGTYNYQIDLSEYDSGIYFLTLETNNRKQTQKIVKQ